MRGPSLGGIIFSLLLGGVAAYGMIAAYNKDKLPGIKKGA